MAQTGAVYRGKVRTSQEKHLQRKRTIRMNRIMLGATTTLVMLCLFAYISKMAAISSTAKEINQTRKEISNLKEEQQYLEVVLAARQNLDRVRDEATGRLGMNYPAEGQVQVVSLSGYSASVNTQTAHDSTMP